MSIRTLSPRDSEGRIFRNDGPVNPVANIDAARVMANAEYKVFERVERAYLYRRYQAMQEEQGTDAPIVEPYASSEDRVNDLLENIDIPWEKMNKASEKTRLGIATQNLELAKGLYSLVEIELVPVVNTPSEQ